MTTTTTTTTPSTADTGRGRQTRRRHVAGVRARRWARTLLLGALPVALISTFLVFLMTYLASGNPAAQKLGDRATPEEVTRLNASWGLDRSFPEQYLSWLGHAVRGDLGKSYFSGLSVTKSIGERLPVDASITLVAVVVAVLAGFAAGILAALRQGGITDRAITVLAAAATTIPEFWLAIMFVSLFSLTLGWLPSGGYVPLTEDPGQWLLHVLLPGGSLGLAVAAQVARQLRTSLLAAFGAHYVLGARVRGLSTPRILFGHILRNAAAPAIATLGLAIPTLLGGAVIAEAIFGLPGLGQYALSGAQSHDIPVIQGVLVVSIVLVLSCNLAVDAFLGWLRPATRGTR
ncbi:MULTISPECIES: ABC transporter permease [Protofrankia]|uniref:ABC transporter permease n=1 Tax=Protofrankia TaxID=2994361 RepID=UPI00069C9603|nr:MULTISPECIES: ABC transporter permease [Protofrankia]ONH33175.1 ABC transporter permease [Protofrankia sp. BMG5.30]